MRHLRLRRSVRARHLSKRLIECSEAFHLNRGKAWFIYDRKLRFLSLSLTLKGWEMIRCSISDISPVMHVGAAIKCYSSHLKNDIERGIRLIKDMAAILHFLDGYIKKSNQFQEARSNRAGLSPLHHHLGQQIIEVPGILEFSFIPLPIDAGPPCFDHLAVFCQLCRELLPVDSQQSTTTLQPLTIHHDRVHV